jgi:hypothetical protein
MKTEYQTTFENTSKALNISRDRYEYIVRYVMRMLKDYQGDVIDIVKEIPLNLKGNERYFTMYMMGNSTSSAFSRMNDKQKAGFIKSIMEILKISQEKAESIIHHMAEETRENMKKNYFPTDIDIIKKIIDSEFTETEKDYLLFTLRLVYT